ncbi:flagellin N-terminal helical domain-containing protein [Halomonas sp. TG39a]|uniref:flagellin N-terminal helical domain-containing protein n=1 Tax=Halomonas sp. TG39a TaxID=1415755 RepID=UPI00055980C9|nr:flagellin [Halomonas sp. TG39a]
MAVINTNLLSLNGQNQLKRSHSAMETAIERLSSGLRINGAKDDAAGQAIANRMESNLQAGKTLTQGINDGISLMQTAEGGLDSINDILQRARELAIQSANGTLSDADRSSINAEYQQLAEEVDRLAFITEAFGKTPLAPAEPRPLPVKLGDAAHITELLGPGFESFTSGTVSLAYVPAGATNVTLEINSLGLDDDIQIFTQDGKHLIGTPIDGAHPDHVWQSQDVTDINASLLTAENGFEPGASYDASLLQDAAGSYDLNSPPVELDYNDMKITYSGDGDRLDEASADDDGTEFNNGNLSENMLERVTFDKVTENLIVFVVGQGSFNARATWDDMPIEYDDPEPVSTPVSTPTNIVVSAGVGQKMDSITIAPTPSDTQSLGLEGVALDPIEKALEAMQKLEQAMGQVDGYRSQYGALNNRFESAIGTLSQEQVNLGAAKSRIEDADYAVEASNMMRTQILQQAGTSMLAQANQNPQSVLSLLD